MPQEAIYRAIPALGSKVGKELDKDTKNASKKRKEPGTSDPPQKPKNDPQDTRPRNVAREALQAQTKDLVARWKQRRKVGVRSFWATGAKKSCLNIETKCRERSRPFPTIILWGCGKLLNRHLTPTFTGSSVLPVWFLPDRGDQGRRRRRGQHSPAGLRQCVPQCRFRSGSEYPARAAGHRRPKA